MQSVGTVNGTGSLLWHLARHARDLRHKAHAKPIDIAVLARVDLSTVYRFEGVKGWPRSIEALIVAYGMVSGIRPVDIWQTALDGWERDQHGLSRK
jgi:hypothetical protein